MRPNQKSKRTGVVNIRSLRDGEVRLDRRTASNTLPMRAHKEGGGGKFTWGRPGDERYGSMENDDPNDPNYIEANEGGNAE